MPSCLACGIAASNPRCAVEGISFHRFPVKREAVCELWKKLWGIAGDVTKNSFLCSLHFERMCYMNPESKHLMPYAIPTKGAPHTEFLIQVGDHYPPFVPELGPIGSLRRNDTGERSEELQVPEGVGQVEGGQEVNVTCGEPQTFPLPEASTPTSCRKSSLQHSGRGKVLFSIHARNVAELTPRKKTLYGKICRQNKLVQKLKKKLSNLRAEVNDKDTGKGSVLSLVSKVDNYISSSASILFRSQIANASLPPRCRRWTVEDKALAMAIYKRSPSCYRFLSHVLALPSRGTISRSLRAIPFTTGINESIFSHLAKNVKTMSRNAKFCSLIFDEISLSGGFQYDVSADKIVGYEDYGHLGRTREPANHALVFMVRGIIKKWKQPVAYFFCGGTTPAVKLKVLIKIVVAKLQSVGLKVVAVVHDMSATNVSAVKDLCKETRSERPGPFFEVGGEQIIDFCDPPHLLKCTRNNFRKYNVHFEGKVATWSHIKEFFRIDSQRRLRFAPRVTEKHVFPEGFLCMKVSFAAQVLSRTVAASLIGSAIQERDAYDRLLDDQGQHMYLPFEARETAEFIGVCDELFDSFNGSSRKHGGKPLRQALTAESNHWKFWNDMIGKINSWKFRDGKGRVIRNSFQDGWVNNIRAVRMLWKKLSGMGVDKLWLRNLNQDPLENLFCVIRQHGYHNVNPTCYQFISCLKTSLVNNLVNKSIREMGNCEADDSKLISNLTSFMQPTAKVPTTHNIELAECDSLGEDVFSSTSNDLHSGAAAASLPPQSYWTVPPRLLDNNSFYVSGYVVRRIFSEVTCDSCKPTFLATSVTQNHSFISQKECVPGERHLTYPSVPVTTVIEEVGDDLEKLLPGCSHQEYILKRLMRQVSGKISLRAIGCEDHSKTLQANLLKFLCKWAIFRFCKQSRKRGSSQPIAPQGASKKMRKAVRR